MKKHSIAFLLLLFSGSILFCNAQTEESFNYPDSLNKGRLKIVLAAEAGVYAAGISYLNFIWYKDHELTPFHFYNDNNGWLQMDKAGHAFSAYQESRWAYGFLRWAGVKPRYSAIYAGVTSFAMQLPIEIMDGLYEGYGFSTGDIGANAFGSALFSIQQLAFNDQIIKMKFSYYPSGYPKYHPYNLGESQIQSFFMDYNAHTYWLSLNLRSIFRQSSIPAWLALSFGYSGNGMLAEFKNPISFNRKPIPCLKRYRQYLFSIDVDLSKIKTKNKFLKAVFNNVNMLKIPFPALEYNSLEGLKFRELYF